MFKKFTSILLILVLLFSFTSCKKEEEKPEYVAVLISDIIQGYTPINEATFINNWDLDIPLNTTSYSDSSSQITALEEHFTNGATGAIVCLANTQDAIQFINIAKENKSPIILYGATPSDSDMQSYDKCWYIGDLPQNAGEIMGKIIIDGKNSGLFADVNEDLLLQYAVVEGERGNIYSDSVVTYAPRVIENYGLFTDRINAEDFIIEEVLDEESEENEDDSEDIIIDEVPPQRQTDESYWTSQGTQEVLLNLILNSDKQLEAVLVPSPDIAVATVNMIKDLGFAHKVNIVSYGVNDEVKSLIDSGDMLGAAAYDEATATDIMINFMENALNKKSVTKDTQYYLDKNRCTYINYEKIVCKDIKG